MCMRLMIIIDVLFSPAGGFADNRSRRWLPFAIALFLFPTLVLSQQLPDRSVFPEKSFIWNPAMTAPWDYWEGAIDYRQQWLGFEDAPRTALVDFQYPVLDYNNSIGGFFMQDNIKPLKTSIFGLTYAYKVKFGRRRPDQLSIGVMGTMSQHFLDALEVVVNDQGDEFIPSGEISKFSFNAGLGLFYTSYAKDDFDRNFFYFGLAANQLLPSKLVFDEFGGVTGLKRAIHANAIAGMRLIKEDIFIEPSLWVNYSSVNVINAHLNIKMEKHEAFWAGLTYVTNHTIAIQAGLITTKGFAREGSLRIGTMGSYNIGSFGQFRGLGYEAYVAYRFEL